MRPAIPADLEEIVRLLDLAFAPNQFESRLILALARNARPTCQWLIEIDGVLLAHICYSRAYREERAIGFHLAPVAIHPEHQRRGLGSSIIGDTLLQTPIAGSPVLVVGGTSYYTRFGFRRVTRPVCRFEPSNEHFMALRYASQDEFLLGYEPEFMMGEPDAAPNAAPPPR
jgi:putative acetyltransferase